MISVGDGEMQKKIEAGLCPKCHSQLVEKPQGYDCVICGIQIENAKKSEKSVNNA